MKTLFNEIIQNQFKKNAFKPVSTAIIFVAFIMAFLPSCAKMSLQEARQVAVSINDSAYTPPPRKIDDITTAFDQYKADPDITRQLMARAASHPPKLASEPELLEFYFQRGLAAQKLGNLEQCLDDFRTAMKYLGQNKEKNRTKQTLFLELALMELCFSNIKNSEKILQQGRQLIPKWVGVDVCRTTVFALLGNIEKAEQARKQALGRMNDWDYQNPWRAYYESMMAAEILDAKGKYREAETQHRRALMLAMAREIRSDYPAIAILARRELAENLMYQDRLSEAEVEARLMLLETMDAYGKQSYRTLWRAFILSDILVKQERFGDAEKLLKTIIKTLISMKINDSALIMCEAAQALGETLAAQGRWMEALSYLQAVRQNLEKNPAISKRYRAEKTTLPVCLLKTGQSEKALAMLSESYEVLRRDLGLDHIRSRQTSGLKALAYADLNRQRESLAHFAESVPFLLQHRTKNRQQLKLILEGYLELLDRIKGSALAREAGIDAVKESFRIANAAHSNSIHRAIAESATRLAMKDSDLASITREEQDAKLQINALEATLARHLSAPTQQQSSTVIADLRRRITDLRQAQKVLSERVKSQYPQYARILDPVSDTVREVRRYLRPGEVYVSFYTTETQTHIWAIPFSGTLGYSTAALGRNDIRQNVAILRKALAPSLKVLGDIPEFDLVTAYQLYGALLKPVEATLKNARDLLIVAPGPLGPLPFSVLPTKPVKLDDASGILFAKYRQVPWLIRKVSITRLPGASAFISLRKLPETNKERRMFAGFGDPIFNPAQLNTSRDDHSTVSKMVSRGGVKVSVRGIRNTSKGNLDASDLVSGRLGHLNRLPDTAREINSIARILEADAEKDVFLGTNATEARIKTMDLSDRRVIVFASHALVPGDLDGLDQPALALSAPSVTGDQEDGILTMEEILRLKLNADWVVLSACNTGAAEGAGAEAVSGLGRAFFYAGTKSILVSMWPVETTSASKLTTGVFFNQKQDQTLSRSRSLQKAVLDLMDKGGFKDPSSGRIVATYAHPLFWAPFIIVGEGGNEPSDS